MVGVTDWGLKRCAKVQTDYNAESWEPLKAHFRSGRDARGTTTGPEVEGEQADKTQVPHYA